MSAKGANNCICVTCGKGFHTPPSGIARGQGKYCEQACQTTAQTKGIERACEQCGAIFRPEPSAVAAGWGRYCGTDCRAAAQRKRVTLTCETCGRPVERTPSSVKHRTFCSTTCDRNRPPEPIILDSDGLTARIPLHTRDGSIRDYALIDAGDAEWAGRYYWCLDDGYVRRYGGIRLHRDVLGLTPGDGLEGDHINLDKLDNRRNNLRVVTRPQSAQNKPSYAGGSSQYRGVAWSKSAKLWVASCNVGGKRVYMERFGSELEAAEAARAARARYLPFATN
jgi:hypothetical protein